MAAPALDSSTPDAGAAQPTPDAIGAAQEALQTLLTCTTDSLYWAHASALPEGHHGRPPQEECAKQLALAIPDLEAAAKGLLQSIDALPDLDLDKRCVEVSRLVPGIGPPPRINAISPAARSSLGWLSSQRNRQLPARDCALRWFRPGRRLTRRQVEVAKANSAEDILLSVSIRTAD